MLVCSEGILKRFDRPGRRVPGRVSRGAVGVRECLLMMERRLLEGAPEE